MRAFVDGIEVPIAPEKVPAFSFQLADPIAPGSVRGSSSPPIKLPATAEVQEIFGSHQNSEALDTSTHRLVIMEGSAVIHEAEVIGKEWSRDFVEVVCVGDSASWMAPLRDTQISSVNLDKFGPVDSANQTASWTADQPVVFPLIDYGLFQDRLTTYDVQVGDVWPGVRVPHILNRAFTNIGYSLRFEGQARDKYNKLIIPFSGKEVPAAPEQLVVNACTSELSAPATPAFSGAPPHRCSLPTDTAVSDPSGLFSGTAYVPQLTGLTDVRATIVVEYDHPTFGGSTILPGFVYATVNGLAKAVQIFHVFPNTPGVVTRTLEVELKNIPTVAGLPCELKFGAYTQYTGALLTSFTVVSCAIAWTPSQFLWQEGIEFYPCDTLPKMTVAELFSSVCKALNCVVVTDDLSKSVIVRHMDEHFKPTTEGDDWTGIQDMATAPSSERTVNPLVYQFKYKEDNNDMGTDIWADNERPYGGYNFDMGRPRSGVTEVACAFAPTYMGYRFDAGCYIPVMIDKGNEGNTEFKTSFQPRLLYFDGVTEGRWTFDGTALNEHPKAWFVPMSASEPSLSFGDETQGGPVVPGTVTRHHLNNLSRLKDGKMFTTRVALDDVDIMERDFRKPKLLSDGVGKGWYLLLGIKNYLWGGRKTTEILTIKV